MEQSKCWSTCRLTRAKASQRPLQRVIAEWDVNQPIGVVIDAVNTPSPLGEWAWELATSSAIDDQACLSHPHAMQLLQATSSSLVTLIVWQRRPQGREHASAGKATANYASKAFFTANEPDEPVPLL